jgi:hypothetical protein
MPRPTATRRVVLAAAAAIAMQGLGCRRPTYPVTGIVVYEDGTPYAGGGIVAMETDIDGKRVMARGAIGTDGRFLLASTTPGDGAFAGRYRVRVLPVVSIDGPATTGIASQFQSFETSGLSFDVGTGPNEFTITIGPKPGR